MTIIAKLLHISVWTDPVWTLNLVLFLPHWISLTVAMIRKFQINYTWLTHCKYCVFSAVVQFVSNDCSVEWEVSRDKPWSYRQIQYSKTRENQLKRGREMTRKSREKMVLVINSELTTKVKPDEVSLARTGHNSRNRGEIPVLQ